MYCCDDDKHVEIYVKPNEEPETEGDDFTIIVFARQITTITISISIALELVFNFDVFPEINLPGFQAPETTDNVELAEPLPSVTPGNPELDSSGPGNPGPVAPSGGGSSQDAPPSNHQRVLISQFLISRCHGRIAPGANFRNRPSLSASEVKGVVPAGDYVTLVGPRIRDSEGHLWHEAMNESELAHSADFNSIHQTEAGQTGWIHSCFVD